ncbi:anti-sigma factor family protein [Gemmatimonadota bacterium]
MRSTMTAHPDDGLIQAFLDHELDQSGQEQVAAHLEECGACRRNADELQDLLAAATRGLAPLDAEPPTELAMASLAGRLGDSARARLLRAPSLARAAGIALLLMGGAVSALPGSPVRRWISSGWDRLSGGGAVALEETDPSATNRERSPDVEAGAGIGVAGGEVELRILDLPARAEVRVLLVDGDMAGIYGPEGTHFRTEAGRLEAVAPLGGLRVEVPRSAARASVFVNGELYFLKTGDRLEILGPVQDSAAAEIRFLTGASPGSNGETR